MYNLEEKYAKLGKGGPNPFIDPEGYKLEVDIDEAMFRAVLAEQAPAARARRRRPQRGAALGWPGRRGPPRPVDATTCRAVAVLSIIG